MIRYPNGKTYAPKEIKGKETTKKKSVSKDVQYENRGMTLEEDLNQTNEYYLYQGMAVIHKKPTPIQIVKVDYRSRAAAKITEAYFRTPSTTDYSGVYKAKYVDFEAKETKNKTSFPLQNFHPHQIIHMKKVKEQQGICFAIVRFTELDETYVLDADVVIKYWNEKESGGRKSIPYHIFQEQGHKVKYGFQARVDYLSVIDEIYFTHKKKTPS